MRQILLIEPDVDLLGQLAERLRARGLAVALADDVPTAVARARAHPPHIVFVSASLARRADLWERLTAEANLAGIPRMVLVRAPTSGSLPPEHVAADDIDRLVARALEVTPASLPPEAAQGGELRGDVQQVSLVDLLQLLAMNRRSGVLTVATVAGAGELRIADGEVLDSVFRRLEGEKAFYRLLTEREGTFVFSPGGPPAMARITRSTSMLLMEAMRHKDEVGRLRDELSHLGSAFVASGSLDDDDPRSLHDVLDALTRPRSIDELIDELPSPDLDLLQALRDLVHRGLARRVEHSAELTSLAPPDQLPLVRALAARLSRDGFTGPPRLAIASSPTRVHAFGHSLLRLQGATASAEPPPTAPAPHDLGTLRLGEGVELLLVGLPLVDAFSPLWALALPGTAAVLRLDDSLSPVLSTVCDDLECRLISASELVPGFDELVPSHIAQLIRLSIEQASSG